MSKQQITESQGAVIPYSHKPDWKTLVTEGCVWHAKISTRAMPARRMTFAALLILGAGFYGISKMSDWYLSNSSGALGEDTKEAQGEAMNFRFHPQFNLATPSVMQKIYASDPSVNYVKPEDLQGFVIDSRASLTKTSKLAAEAVEVKLFSDPLATDSHGPDVVRIKTKENQNGFSNFNI